MGEKWQVRGTVGEDGMQIQCQRCGLIVAAAEYALPAGWIDDGGVWHCDKCENDSTNEQQEIGQ